MNTALTVLAEEADQERSHMTAEQLLRGLVTANRKLATVSALGAPKSVLEVSAHNVEGYRKALSRQIAGMIQESAKAEEESHRTWSSKLSTLASQAALV